MYSLPDWAFYPIAALLMGGMIALALSFGENEVRTDETIRAEGVVFEGGDLQGLVVGSGLEVAFLNDTNDAFARIQAVRGPFDGIHSAGAFFALPPGELAALEGHSVRLRYTLRSADENGAAQSRITFFSAGIGQESWQVQTLTGDFAEYEIEVSPPNCAWGNAYLGLWPDWEAEANTVDLLRVELQIIEPLACD
jgi:hypothetical protein